MTYCYLHDILIPVIQALLVAHKGEEMPKIAEILLVTIGMIGLGSMFLVAVLGAFKPQVISEEAQEG